MAVIGPNADRLYNQLGDYTSVQREGTGTTVLQGIRACAPQGVDIVYALGCGIRDRSKAGFAESGGCCEGGGSGDSCARREQRPRVRGRVRRQRSCDRQGGQPV
ncbi:hypothetical protein [Paenibacillus phoenicis]|uniref:hypothetical protein n=1 Tax=Paenibacillus phoenicis TaxID=554117 RepID=UPI003D26BA23